MNKETNNGIGFGGLLCIVLITLKLIGIINWSWLWVLSPILIPFAIWLVLVVIMMVIIVVKSILE